MNIDSNCDTINKSEYFTCLAVNLDQQKVYELLN